jgi:soluble lytic murein transglycosylase-like protein
VICDCQRHAQKRNRWRRVVRVATRGVAVLATVPFAYFFDIPTKAMNLTNVAALRPQFGARRIADNSKQLPVFTTPATSEQFISTTSVQDVASVDAFKEQYFRAHVPYGSIIYREARRNNLPPELVAAMVHTESDFRPQLVSHKSAQGLMQIIPDTARDLGITDPFNPEENIAAGTKYFRYLLNRFENEAVALAAYNAGEGKVERCRCIPDFRETRDYITRVNRRTDRYRARVHNTYIAAVRMRTAVR